MAVCFNSEPFVQLSPGELVGNREAQQPERQLVFGFDCKDVAVDRFQPLPGSLSER
jgi:hypothetical protein